MNLKRSIVALCASCCIAFAGMSRGADVLIDFSGTAGKLFVGTGAWPASAGGRQVEDVPGGVRVRVDTDNEDAVSPWTTVEMRSVGRDVDLMGREVSLVCKEAPSGRIEKRMPLNFTDKYGETMQLYPVRTGANADGSFFLVYDVTDRTGRTWGGRERNGKLDAPVRLSAINLQYDNVYNAGEVTFLRLETVDTKEVRCDVTSIEPISTDTTYPGAAPFPGAEVLTFKVEPAFAGKATLVLSSGAVGAASSGTMTRYAGEGAGGNVRFRVGLPYQKRYEFMRIEYAPAEGSPKGPYRIVSAIGEFRQTAAEAMRLDVDTGNFMHLVRDATERPVLVVRNPARRDIPWRTVFRATDDLGRRFEIPFDETVPSGGERRIALPWPLPAKGLWRIEANVTSDDGSSAVKSTRFASVDRHGVTPVAEKPAFRIGIHYHGTHYLPDLVDKTIEAMVASGAKFTRTDYSFMFGSICKADGSRDWSRPDMMVEKLRAAGLSLDIIIANNRAPRWAVDPDAVAARADQTAKDRVLVTRPGLFRGFCEEFARRYNSKIDYYEVGNEWDMVYTKSLTNEEALRMQREAYEGVHAGYPQGCVTPNGWASVSSAANLWGRATENMGIIEEFAAHPELYDAWMLHAHCAPSMFYQRIRRCFLPLREATGLKTRPWVCNETALTCGIGGERAVGRAVWEKILYAWAWGASDYIWYNLRATGWFEGHEPGYGLITPDFYPRSGYASMAALTTIFQGLSSDGRLYSEGDRHLMRFKGEKDGFKGLVLAAWDSATRAKRRSVRIRTDAVRAEASDYMGNRAPLPVKDGMAVIQVDNNPSAYLLNGATVAEIVDVAEIANPKTEVIEIPPAREGRPPDFRLDSMDQVRDFYQALPQHVRRTWGGQRDHAARIWLERAADGGLRVRAKVQDDIRGPEDGIEVFVAPPGGGLAKHLLKPSDRRGETDIYDATIPFYEELFDFTLHVMEDDGDGGLDGYMQLTGDSEPPLRLRLSKSTSGLSAGSQFDKLTDKGANP